MLLDLSEHDLKESVKRDLRHLRDQKEGMRRNVSGASISTRAPSTDSLSTFGYEESGEGDMLTSSNKEKEEQEDRGVLSSVGLRRRAALVAAMVAVLAWAWSRYVRRVSRRPGKWGSGRLTLPLSALLFAGAQRLGVTAHDDTVDRPDSIPKRQVLACWHPHGLYTATPLFFLSAGPRNQTASTYGWFTIVASACFQAPIFREILILGNAREADKRVISGLLSRGKSVALCPGGIHEQLETDPAQERIFFPPNLGFIRQAIQHGVPLLPLYNFGENQLYDVPEWSKAFSGWLKRRFNIGFPLGLGRWGLPFVPRQQQISIRIGRLIEVGPAEAQPSDEQVRGVFLRYCRELQRLFDEHAAADLPPEVAARGLELIWRGHEAEDLSWAGLARAEAAERRRQHRASGGSLPKAASASALAAVPEQEEATEGQMRRVSSLSRL